METIEYRVRPVTRYVVTRYEGYAAKADGNMARPSSRVIGEYDNADMAYEVGYAVTKAEHEKLGWPPGDMRIKYPERPASGQIVENMTMSGSGVMQDALARPRYS